MNLIKLPGELKRLEALVALALGRANGNAKSSPAVIRIPISTGASQSSSTSIPAGAVVLRAFLDIVTPYTAGATIALGTSVAPSAFMAAADSNPQIADLYDAPQDTTTGAVSKLLVTVTGGPAAGGGFACVEFVAVPLP